MSVPLICPDIRPRMPTLVDAEVQPRAVNVWPTRDSPLLYAVCVEVYQQWFP
jgi:hypothetical protein